MKIKLTSVYVDDQDKALRFYTEVLGFMKKTDFTQGPFRWLTVASRGTGRDRAAAGAQRQPGGQGIPAGHVPEVPAGAMFYTDDVQADYERMKARGAEFTMPPTDVTGSKIAKVNDTCGNLIQITQLTR